MNLRAAAKWPSLATFLSGIAFACSVAAAPKDQSPIISLSPDGRLIYAFDHRGNRVPDFSHCGYAAGGEQIPNAPVRVVVSPGKGDTTARVQDAINFVSSLPADADGIRGAVLLLKGRHEISGSLLLSASGVVLRGQGMGEGGTILAATGNDRRTLVRIAGRDDRSKRTDGGWRIVDQYVPVGATSFRLEKATGLQRGDTICLIRPSVQAWIDRLGMTEFGGGEGDFRLRWKPGSRDLLWDRVITAVEGDVVTVDAPITTAIEAEFGGGTVEAYSWPGRLSQVGVENLRLESVFDPANPKDENHSWMAITLENVENAWVRQVTAKGFAGSMVAIYESCKWVTVQDCLSLAPVSEEAGYRRHTFFTMGQLTLFLRCYSENGRHDFSAGHCAAGPNAFVQCEARLPWGDSGPIESWAAGVLYDNVTIDGNGLSLANRGSSGQGAGWAAANSALWQCSASVIRCANPPTAQNWAFGSWGEFEGDGLWRSSNEFVEPASLYAAQLRDRLGQEAAARLQLMPRSSGASSNPTIEKAAELARASSKPAAQLLDYIAAASRRDPIPSEPEGVGEFTLRATGRQERARRLDQRLVITNSWLTINGRLVTGGKRGNIWWRGNIRPSEAPSFGVALTRYVPGRTGLGYTDDLVEVADHMDAAGDVVLDHNYGLWYDRRRDDHQRVRRMTGDVWPPFYEQPFARSGQGVAWDGLSRYDLTRFNPWYWSRLKEFATVCQERGLLLFHQNYFQHNILEAGAHWADSPWRSANNINNTGFPEPPPYAGDKRIFMAHLFYDAKSPVRRELHRAYIRQCLENFAETSNVLQFTSAEYTGPLEFVQFWLDTIAEWKREPGRATQPDPVIALSATRDVQDAVLADPERSGLIDVIDFRYWWQTDQGLFAPKGGQHLAPRQSERQWKGGRPNDRNLAVMAADYRLRFPDKAVICNFEEGSWAFLCAGGSIPNLPMTTDSRLLSAIPRMKPGAALSSSGRWVLHEPGKQLLGYFSGENAELDLSQETGVFRAYLVDLATGKISESGTLQAGKSVVLPTANKVPVVAWLTKESPAHD